MKTTIINKILLVLMLITAQQVSALEFQVDGIYYRTSIFTKNSAYVTHSGTSYTESVEYQGEVVIPESVTYNGKTYTIASIGGYAFAGCPGLTSVTIPSTVTTINQNAFNGCTGLKTIECKATTPPALGDNAFTSYDATLVVPSSSESAYKSAAGWSNFKFKEESSETPGSGENSGEDNTGGGSDSGEDSGSDNSGSDNTYGLACKILNSTDVAIIAGTEKYTGDIIIPSQVTISGKTYTVTSIADDAFKGCTGLTSITIPSSITSIGSSSFDSCTNLNKVSISDMLSWCKITFANSLANPLYYAKNLYLNGSLVSKLEIPSAITEIKNYTFYNCTSISTIVFPSGILKIGNSAFVNCSNMTSVTIPNSVTTIDENAFNGCTGLASLTIGSSVGSIGNYAFGNCTGLKSVTSLNSTPPTCGTGVFQGVTISSIPLTVPAGSESLYKATYTWQDFKYKEEAENPGDDPAVDTSGLKYNIISSTDVEVVAGTEKYTGDIVIPSQTTIDGKTYNVTKIGIQAFNGCAGLTSITIPNSVTNIEKRAFESCTSLTNITIPNSVTFIGNSAFYECSNLTNIEFLANVTSIGEYTFTKCLNLNSISIPEGVISIENYAFSSCAKLSSINIPNSVTNIGTYAFYNCSGLTKVEISSLEAWCKINFEDYDANPLYYARSLYLNGKLLTSIEIPNSISEIKNYTFHSCSSLTSIIIPNSVTSIGISAFSNCKSLTETTIPNSVITIGKQAFRLCTSLTKITIPNSVTAIGDWAFYGCSSLSVVEFNAENCTTMGGLLYPVFNDCTKLTTLIIGNNVKDIPNYAFYLCASLQSVDIPNSVTNIGHTAFKGCESLKSVKIGNSVKNIGVSAFHSCSILTSIDIPNSVTSINDDTFYGCSSLASLTIGNSVTSIGSAAFSGCVGLSSVVIPNSVTVIDAQAFLGCTGLINVTIGGNVKELGIYAFSSLTSLKIIYCLNPTPPACEEDVFYNVSVGNITLEVPAESVSMYQSADTWKDFGTIKGISEEEPELPEDTSGLSYNIINETEVEVIAGAEKYTGDIVIPSQTTIDGKVYNVIKVGEKAFYGCDGLTSITIPNSVISIGDNAFGYCSGLTSITIPNSVTSIGNYAFRYCNGLTSVTIGNSVTSIGQCAFFNCDSLTSITIPNSVTSIGDFAFAHFRGLKSITIPNSVTSIGNSAFRYCSGLTSVTIGNSVTTIGDYAFEGCTGLTSVTIPNSVTSISSIAFLGCSGLTSIVVESGNTVYDSRNNCNAIIKTSTNTLILGCKNTTIPNSVTSIGDEAFYSCTGLTSVTIGNSVTSISSDAFSFCDGLESIKVDSGNSIYDSRDNCNAIIETSTNTLISGCKNTTIPNSVTSIGAWAFCGCDGLTSVTIPNSVTSIGQYAFGSCTGLTSITIPNSVINIGGNAFYYCSGLTTISIPNSVISIGNNIFSSTGWYNNQPNGILYLDSCCLGYKGDKPTGNLSLNDNIRLIAGFAFSGCSGLTSITIPNSVTNIGERAFSGCDGLTSVISLNPTPPACEEDVFYNVSVGNITLEVPAESVSLYQSADTWKDFGTIKGIAGSSALTYNILNETDVEVVAGTEKCTGDIVIPSQTAIDGKVYNVTSIGNTAFAGCSGLTSVTIPNSVTRIGDLAFNGCSGLTSITIPSSVTSIGENAFRDCSGLTSVIFNAENCETMGSSIYPVFYICTKLSSVTIGQNVKSIPSHAFCGCYGLTGVTIPNSVTSIGEAAFSGCRGLTSIIVESGNTVYDSRDNCNAIIETSTNTLITGCKNTVIPNSVTSIGYSAFDGCSGLTGVTIPEGVTSIGDDAFFGCSGLTSITIPEGVTSIGDDAFSCCSGLTSITIPEGVTSIGSHVFRSCSSLTSITIPNSVTSIGEWAFFGCSSLTSVIIPNSVTSIGEMAFSSCNGLTSIVVESGNTVYDSRDNCNAIIETSTNTLITGCKNTVIPNSVTSIGYSAFDGCSGLTSITIPNSVTSIGSSAFDGCSGLTSVTIGNSVTSIGNYAFSRCNGLTSVTIPNSVTSIGMWAFSGCSALTSVTIPNSVTSIGEGAFCNCSGLTSITSLNPTPPSCGTNVFYNVSVGNITLEVPAESVSMYQSADTWKDFGTIETYISYPVGLSKMWAIPFDPSTGLCSVRTVNGFGDVIYGANNTAGTIEEWKDGVLVASYDVNKFCADNQLGETDKVIDSETGTEAEKFTSYVLWTAVMVDDAGNLLVNVGPGPGTASTCQNWVLLPASDRNAMQLLHIDEFPSADVTLGRVDVPSRIVGNITDGGAYLYIPATNSVLMPVMYIALDGDGKIYYDAENSWILMSSVTFDASTNVATFQTADEILGAADEAGVAAKTYVRWRGRGAPFTWNAETSQLEQNTSFVPGVVGTPGMDVFKIGEVEYIVVPVKSATTGSRGSSVAVYNLADGSEVANWDSGCSVDYYVGSVQARVNPDGKTANIYVCGHKDCFGILKFYPGSSVKSIANEGLSYGKGSSALDEIVTEENAGIEYYNLQGVRVMNPEKGIYIKRQGGKTSKVVL